MVGNTKPLSKKYTLEKVIHVSLSAAKNIPPWRQSCETIKFCILTTYLN